MNERALQVAQHKEEGKPGNAPKTLDPVRCARLLTKEVPFILFDSEENTKLAMYLDNDGIYTQNYSLIKRVIAWLEPRHNSNKAEDVIYHIKNLVGIKKKTQSPYLIPVGNGVYNRQTGQLEPFSPDYIFTTKVSTPYIEGIKSPMIDGWTIDDWLKEIACHDNEIVTLLWQVLNDSLNGNYTRKKAIFLVGDGNNGKGTFQDLIKYLVGEENVAYLKIDEFEKQFKTSVLFGKTVVIGDDVPVGVYIDDSSTFKSVTTGDSVLVEFKGKQPYSTNFYCTVIQSTNGMPRFKDKTNGNLRRLLIVPFEADFNGQVENRKIKDEYIKNKEVLQYVLSKAIKLDFENFTIPTASQRQLDVFMQDNDPVYDFKVNVFDEWLKGRSIKYLPQAFVYEAYERYIEHNNGKPLGERQFVQRLSKYLGKEWESGQPRKLTTDKHIQIINELAEKEHITFNIQRTKTYRNFINNSIKLVG
ncbi:nucleoside triphosphatase [Macrococcus hajekii]|uniref:Nucleoside triphosphatase n=2 Tax=Macrococcus hajekii TaxID=198482 RepID=A0A4R6BKE3_9STAP|nr:nucleoside triphosphatase [Macrococcus hajekii]